jgi:polysaccharide export outer membrane protein
MGLASASVVSAQTAQGSAPRTPDRAPLRQGVEMPPRQTAPAPAQPQVPPPPPGYVIGPEDVLTIVYWRDKDMTTDVQVRPDGKISLPLINEVDAAGLTPEQLREELTRRSQEFFEDPNVAVVVKTINSRKVFVMGQVAKTGPFPLTGPTTVMQLLSLAGGLGEYADSENIRILRTEKGRQVSYRVNYKDLRSGKKLEQNIELKPGDTIVVP